MCGRDVRGRRGEQVREWWGREMRWGEGRRGRVEESVEEGGGFGYVGWWWENGW